MQYKTNDGNHNDNHNNDHNNILNSTTNEKKQYGNMNSKNKKRKIKILLAHFSSESITGTDSDAYLADRSDRPRSRRQAPNAKENKIKHVILR